MRFVHCSDLHLGKTINNSRDRYNDYFRAFRRLAAAAVKAKADVVVIAGDIFEHGEVTPASLAEAVEILNSLRDESITVLAIEGNHDIYPDPGRSWLLYLSKQGYLKLLRPTLDKKKKIVEFEPFDESKGWGGHVEVKGFSFYGLGYQQGSASQIISGIAENLPGQGDVAIMHAGLWETEFVSTNDITAGELEKLADHFTYTALGHGHRMYKIRDREGRVFAANPGSLEITGYEEAGENRASGTAFLVELTNKGPKIEEISIDRRPFCSIEIDLEGAESNEEAQDRIANQLVISRESEKPLERPVVYLELHGRINFQPSEFDMFSCRNLVDTTFTPIITRINNRLSNLQDNRKLSGHMKIEDVSDRLITDFARDMKLPDENVGQLLDLIKRLEKTVDTGDPENQQTAVELIHRFFHRKNENNGDMLCR